MNLDRHVIEELDDLISGRLGGSETDRVKQHLADCATCQAQWERLRGTRDLLRRFSETEELPSGLAGRISEALDVESSALPWRRRRRWMLATVAVAATIVIAVILVLRRPPADIPASVATTYRSIATGTTALDHRTGNTSDMERWFAERLAFATRVFDLAMMDYQLVGGRVGAIAGRESAVFVYRHSSGALVVCQMYEGRVAELPAPLETRRNGNIDFLVYDRDGKTAVFWQEGDVVCVLVGEIPRDEVVSLAFAKAMNVPSL